MRVLIQGGRVVDPSRNLDDRLEVLIENGRVLDLVPPGGEGDFGQGAEIIRAEGLVVTPGLIDMHVHLREPGHEYKETITSGAAAAAAGGFTGVVAMPNTQPVNDNRSVTDFILAQAEKAGLARVYPVSAMTMGLAGEALCEYGEQAEAGAVAVSDDGNPVSDGQIFRRVLEYLKAFGLPALCHSEDLRLSAHGVMNEGRVSCRLGLAGIPAAAEQGGVFRDVMLAELTGARVHLCHISTAGSVEIVRRAKARGIDVTAETAPHYFTLTEEAVVGYRTEAKMNPPLRTQADLEAVRQGLSDGTLDAVATDHAPHSVLEKEIEFDQAAFGVVGLETALPLTLALVRDKVLTLSQAIAALSTHPARILNLPGGTLAPGSVADVTLIDLDRKWTVEADKFRSLSRNTPFEGWKVQGRAAMTLLAGRPVAL